MATETPLVKELKVLLGTVAAYHTKAHAFHWNVEGPLFPAYHSLFNDIYSDAYGSIDQIAEEIRALDAYAPGGLKRFQELTLVKDEDRLPKADAMITILLADNETILKQYETVIDEAEKQDAEGLMNFLQARVDQHKKWSWQLRATSK